MPPAETSASAGALPRQLLHFARTVENTHLRAPVRRDQGDQVHILTTDLNQAIDDARKFIDADSINEEAFHVVVDMAFNLGLPKLMAFQNFQAALRENDYVKASFEMLDSLWAKQLPNRSKRLAKQMRDA